MYFLSIINWAPSSFLKWIVVTDGSVLKERNRKPFPITGSVCRVKKITLETGFLMSYSSRERKAAAILEKTHLVITHCNLREKVDNYLSPSFSSIAEFHSILAERSIPRTHPSPAHLSFKKTSRRFLTG